MNSSHHVGPFILFLASTSTVPSNLVSTVVPGRRRREEPQQTQRPLVTYED